MEWLLGVPLIPFIVCGVMCLGGLAVAFVLGRTSANRTDDDVGSKHPQDAN
jgi:hypothetical protein